MLVGLKVPTGWVTGFDVPTRTPVPAASAERNTECDTRMWRFWDRCSDESGWRQYTKSYGVL